MTLGVAILGSLQIRVSLTIAELAFKHSTHLVHAWMPPTLPGKHLAIHGATRTGAFQLQSAL